MKTNKQLEKEQREVANKIMENERQRDMYYNRCIPLSPQDVKEMNRLELQYMDLLDRFYELDEQIPYPTK